MRLTAPRRRQYRGRHLLRFEPERDQHLRHAEEQSYAQGEFDDLIGGIRRQKIGAGGRIEPMRIADQCVRQLQRRALL